MSLNKRFRRAIVILLYYPFVASAATKFVICSLCDPRRLLGQDAEPDAHAGSLSYEGMSGKFSGTVVPLFMKRTDVESALPAELTILPEEELPAWLQGRDDHPVILLVGKQENLGKRKRLLGEYRTVSLFGPYFETFVAIPFLKPRASEGPSPCFHFMRVPCSTLWPTELGVLCMGWPKIHCPMETTEHGQVQTYRIKEKKGGKPWLTVETDLTDSVAVDGNHNALDKIRSMLSQPHVLVQEGELVAYRFDLRFEAAVIKAVSASGTIHPGFLPWIHEPVDFAPPKITDSEFGAFRLETTFMNRRLATASGDAAGSPSAESK